MAFWRWLKRLKTKRIVQPIRTPIFIIGCGRSGTTLLFNLLSTHPELARTTGYPDGEDHVGWVKHGKCLISGLGDPQVNGGHTGYHYCLHMDENDVTREIVESMTVYYNETVLFPDFSKRVLNKCPHLSNKLRYVRGIFPDAKFVHIVRDCLPVVASWIKIMEDQPHQVLYWPETELPCLWVLPAPSHGSRERIFGREKRIYPGGGASLFVDYWSVVNRNIPLQLADSPDQLLTVKYEDLCADTPAVLRRICDFCEITPIEEVPFEIHAGFNEKYKKHLTANQIDRFLEGAAATRQEFGYL